MSKHRLKPDAILFIIGLLALWQIVAEFKLISPIFFPSPAKTLVTLYHRAADGSLWTPLLNTTLRMIYGWLFACLTGMVLGLMIGISRQAREYLEPTLEFLRPLPASAMIPVAILFLGLSDAMSTAVIAFGSIWPVLLASIHGFASIEPRLIEVAATLRLSRTQTLVKIGIPAAMPDVLAGARVSLSIALILAIVTEMQASLPGLGQDILLAQRSFKSAELYAGVVMLGILGFVANASLVFAERRLLRWRND
jgi:ABC-type nitrate/sulfonate/bicarbonate transport system permease component